LRNLTALLLVSFIFLTSCKTISFQKYFPLKNDKQSIYLNRIDSIGFETIDTLICREIIAKQLKNIRNDRLNLSMIDRQNKYVIGKIKLYYFESLNLDSSNKNWMNDKSFAERLYCFSENKMYVSFGWDKTMSYDTEMDLLFPKLLKKGVFYKHKNGDYARIFQYLGKENITLNGKFFKNCIKIEIYESLGMTKKIGIVWFAKNSGLIKWTKLNERVEFIKP
jgi:hypothetical protein